jgi:hypothetical protein
MAGAKGMSKKKINCRYCKKLFRPSPYHPRQEVCFSEECQCRRKREYHRNKLKEDPEYRQICADSRKVWREKNPDYQRQYRAGHQAGNEQNRQKQRVRNLRRKLSVIVKNNLAIDVTRSFTEVWMIGPSMDAIVKNNLAISQVMILQTDTPCRARYLTH